MAYRKNTEQNGPVVFIGQKTLDIYLLGAETCIDGSKVTLSSGAVSKTFRLKDGPITEGKDKYSTDDPLDFRGFETIEVWGGGVQNALEGYMRANNHDGHGIYLFDMSPSDVIAGNIFGEMLYERGAECSFYDYRPTPRNLVLIPDGRVGKTIIRGGGGPKPPNRSLQSDHEYNLRQKAGRGHAIFLNSMRDPFIAEIIMEEAGENPNLYAVLTTSLEWDFVRDRVLGYVTPVFNYDELCQLLDDEVRGDENDRIGYAIENIRRIRKDRLNEHHDIHVTLGRNGTLVADTDNIYHARLKPEKSSIVDGRIEQRRGESAEKYANSGIKLRTFIDEHLRGVTGAGDNYAAKVIHSEINEGGKGPVSTAIDACIYAMQYIGYDRVISPSDFEVKIVGSSGVGQQ